MTVHAGIIGGTGVGEKLAALAGKTVHVHTRFGLVRGCVIDHSGRRVIAIQRHSIGHKTPPHLVGYLAMAEGLRLLGANYCLSTAAVGALRPSLKPGDFAVCSDFLDFSGRNLTRFEREVQHTDFSNPIGQRSREALLSTLSSRGIATAENAVYVCTNGPRYETPAEVKNYAQMGGDVVGMTASSEAIAMREAGIDYGCLAIVTNAAAGLSSQSLSHKEVSDQMKKSGETALSILLEAAKGLP